MFEAHKLPAWLLVLLPCSLACQDDGPSNETATTLLDTTGDGDGDSGDGDGDPGDGDGDPGDGDGDPGDGDGDGDSDPCGSGPGCYPEPIVSGAGLSSRAPLGCASSGPFTSPWWFDIAGGGAIDAAKSTPLAADFDDDDDIDILLAARKTSAPNIFPGNGDGSFGAPTQLSGIMLFIGGWGLDAGDIDSDGNTDIVLGDHAEGALAWLNNGGLTFTLADAGLPQGTLYSGAGLGDIDGDLDFDVVLGGDQFGGGYDVVLRDGGTWVQSFPAGLPALGDPANRNIGNAQFYDYDDDGDMDLFAMGQQPTGGVAAFVYENTGAGASWSSRGQFPGGSILSLGNPVQGAIGDVNCDNFVDIAAGGTVYLGDGAGAWSQSAMVDASDLSQLGDLDGDGWLDIVTHSSAGLRLYISDGTGSNFTLDETAGLPDGSYVPPGLVPQTSFEFDDAYGIDLADIDGNGVLDIVRSYKLFDAGVFGDAANENILEVWVR
jgi:hypothetical protein